jgi:acyl carrier protein
VRAMSQKSALSIKPADEIRSWVVNYLSDLLEIDADDVDVTIPFDRYGLDSSAAVGLTGELEDWLGKEVPPTLLYDYPTIEALVEYLGKD